MSCGSDPPPSALDQHLSDYEAPAEMWGLMDGHGNLLNRPMFDDIKPFSEGFAAVNMNGLWGYIDKAGMLKIPGSFLSAGSFKSGRAVVRDHNGRYGVIDISGEVIISPSYPSVQISVSDQILVRRGQDYYFINVADTMKWLGPFTSAEPFDDNVTVVQTGGLKYLMDASGKYLSPGVRSIHLDRSSTLLPFSRDSLWGYLGRDGKIMIPARFQMAQPFREGVAMVKQNGEPMIIDTTGNIHLKSERQMLVLGKGWIAKRAQDQWVLSRIGQSGTALRFSEVHRFHNERAVVRKGENWNYLTPQGLPLLGQNTLLCWDFAHGRARVFAENGMGVIDTTGRFVIPANFKDIRDVGTSDVWAFRSF